MGRYGDRYRALVGSCCRIAIGAYRPQIRDVSEFRVHPAQMRYAKDHKAATRTKIVEVAGRMFRREGIVASGVAALMTEAGLTPGGLYSHFASKDALVAQVLDEALAKTADDVAGLISAALEAGEHPLARAIDAYLSEYHLDTVEISCALASLGSELKLQSEDARVVAASRVEETVEVLTGALPPEERYKAGPLFAMLAATLQMAWLATTREEQMRRLDDGRRAARALVGIS